MRWRICVAGLALALLTATAGAADRAGAFEDPLFGGIDSLPRFGVDSVEGVSQTDRARQNLRNAADLFSLESAWYYPDLSLAGREAALSLYGLGADLTSVYWRGRPLRDPRTGRGLLNYLSLYGVSGSAAIKPGQSFAPTLIFQPVAALPDAPLTALHHREGFYGFQPVEFLHIRPVSQTSRLTFGGYFPRFTGRLLPASAYRGHILSAAFDRTNGGSKWGFSLHDGFHEVENPYQLYGTKTLKSDVDLYFERGVWDGYGELRFYRSESVSHRGDWGDYGREFGIAAGFSRGEKFARITASRIEGRLPAGGKYQLGRLESAIGLKREVRGGSATGSIGASGWVFDRLAPTLSLAYVKPYEKKTSLKVGLSQGVNSSSPEQMLASYPSDRFETPLDPLLNSRRDLPARGGKLPLSLLRFAAVGATRDLEQFGRFGGELFYWKDTRPAGWQVEGDSVVRWSAFPRRSVAGWSARYDWREGYYRASLGMTGLIRDLAGDDPLRAEPPYRMIGEAGWRRSLLDGRLDADVSLLTKFFSSFHSPDERLNEPLGGAATVDLRFTGQIGRFTFYYGLHNLGGTDYTLVPGYPMMHKEEYWGVDWFLID